MGNSNNDSEISIHEAIFVKQFFKKQPDGLIKNPV